MLFPTSTAGFRKFKRTGGNEGFFFYSPIGLLGLAAAWGYICPVGLVRHYAVSLALSTAWRTSRLIRHCNDHCHRLNEGLRLRVLLALLPAQLNSLRLHAQSVPEP